MSKMQHIKQVEDLELTSSHLCVIGWDIIPEVDMTLDETVSNYISDCR